MNPQVKAQMKYAEKNVKSYKLNLNVNTDTLLIAKMEKQDNKQGYLKSLIAKDIENKN